MKVLGIVFIICAGCWGCSYSYIVAPTKEGGDYSYDELNAELKETEAVIALKDGREMQGSQIRIQNDSLSWMETVDKRAYKVLAGDVRSISRKDHAVGAMDGFLLGALLGSASWVLAHVQNPDLFLGLLHPEWVKK